MYAFIKFIFQNFKKTEKQETMNQKVFFNFNITNFIYKSFKNFKTKIF